MVVPIGKVLPDGGVEFTTGVPPHVSLAVTVKYTAVGTLEVSMMFVGQLMLSTQLACGFTVTVKLQWAVLPQVSPAALDTIVVPMGKKVPLGGTLVIDGRLQPPLAVTEKNTLAPPPPVVVTTIFDGQSMVNGVPEACEIAGVNNSRLATAANKILLVFMAKLHLIMFLIDMLYPLAASCLALPNVIIKFN